MQPESNSQFIDQPRAWRRALFLLVALVSGTAGCSEELGPEAFPVARVKGRVTEGGRPITGGWIEFFPVDGGVGALRSAKLQPDGSFDADQVAVGLNLIRLVNTNIYNVDASRMFSRYISPIRRNIPQKPAGPLLIDLVDEAIQFNTTRPKPVLPQMPASGEPR